MLSGSKMDTFSYVSEAQDVASELLFDKEEEESSAEMMEQQDQ